MKHSLPMYLPRPNGTKDVFCENSIRRNKPCDNYVTFNEEGVLITGIVVYHDTNVRKVFCSWKCVESYSRRFHTKKG